MFSRLRPHFPRGLRVALIFAQVRLGKCRSNRNRLQTKFRTNFQLLGSEIRERKPYVKIVESQSQGTFVTRKVIDNQVTILRRIIVDSKSDPITTDRSKTAIISSNSKTSVGDYWS